MQAAKGAEDAEDGNFLKLAAEEAELTRARERLTQKHRNTSRWARRALKRGQTVMDDGEHPHRRLALGFRELHAS